MISPAQLAQTKHWIDRFREIHSIGIPTVLHSHEVDHNGAPQWSPAFRGYLTGEYSQPGPRDSEPTRLKRAMKKVRQHSLREYEVLYRVMQDQTVEEITDWLNARSVRGGHPERYTPATTTVIVFAAVHKLQEWY